MPESSAPLGIVKMKTSPHNNPTSEPQKPQSDIRREPLKPHTSTPEELLPSDQDKLVHLSDDILPFLNKDKSVTRKPEVPSANYATVHQSQQVVSPTDGTTKDQPILSLAKDDSTLQKQLSVSPAKDDPESYITQSLARDEPVPQKEPIEPTRIEPAPVKGPLASLSEAKVVPYSNDLHEESLTMHDAILQKHPLVSQVKPVPQKEPIEPTRIEPAPVKGPVVSLSEPEVVPYSKNDLHEESLTMYDGILQKHPLVSPVKDEPVPEKELVAAAPWAAISPKQGECVSHLKDQPEEFLTEDDQVHQNQPVVFPTKVEPMPVKLEVSNMYDQPPPVKDHVTLTLNKSERLLEEDEKECSAPDVKNGRHLMNCCMSTIGSCAQKLFKESLKGVGGWLFLFILLYLAVGSGVAQETPPKIITGHHIYDVGLSAHLTCRDGGNSVQWLFNGTLANISQFGAIEDKRTDNLVLLRLDNISLHFNNTRFQCRSAGLTSNEVMIQVRGPPTPVSNLRYLSINNTIYWSASYSLDATTYYCVDIYNQSFLNMLFSVCKLNETYFSIEPWSHLLACGEVSVRVSAENTVGSSTSMEITPQNNGINITDIQIKSEPNTTDKTVFLIMQHDVCMDNIEVEVDGTRFTPLPLEDQLNKIKIILKGHKVYENVVVHDIGRGFTTSAIKIATYDVTGVTVVQTHPNRLNIGSTFLNNTNALGVLYELIYMTENGTLDFERSFYFPVNQSVAEQSSFQHYLPRGRYRFRAYDIEWDGHIQMDGQPAAVKDVYVNGSKQGDNNTVYTKKCSIESTEFGANVSCNCGKGHYQVLLLRNYSYYEVKREECSKSIFFALKYDKSHYFTLFYEDTGVFGIPVYYGKLYTKIRPRNSNPATSPATPEMEKDNSATVVAIVISVLIVFAVIILTAIGVPIFCIRKRKCRGYRIKGSDINS